MSFCGGQNADFADSHHKHAGAEMLVELMAVARLAVSDIWMFHVDAVGIAMRLTQSS